MLLQGAIIGIVDSGNTVVVIYSYNAWGDLLDISGTLASTIGELNHLRYRGYYYDTSRRAQALCMRAALPSRRKPVF